MVHRIAAAALIFLLATSVGLTGCQDKLTRPRYETIYIGQPAEQVAKTLGEPTARTDGTWTYVREKPSARVTIRFENDHVVDKEWRYDQPDQSR